MEKLKSRIEKALEGQSSHSLIWGVGQLVMDMCSRSEAAAEIIEQDLDVQEMSLANLAAALEKYAGKHRENGRFFMDDETARRLVREFYKLPAEDEANPQTPSAEAARIQDESGGMLDLADFLI